MFFSKKGRVIFACCRGCIKPSKAPPCATVAAVINPRDDSSNGYRKLICVQFTGVALRSVRARACVLGVSRGGKDSLKVYMQLYGPKKVGSIDSFI